MRQKRSESCRKRMSEAMAGDRRVSDVKERKRKFIEDALNEEEEEVNREKVQKKAESNSEKPTHSESKMTNPSNAKGK